MRVSSSEPIRHDYTFQHWLDEASNIIYHPGSTIQLTKDISLVAQWKETEIFSVTYHYKNAVVETQTYQNVDYFLPYSDFPLMYSYRYWHTDQRGGSEGEQIQRGEPIIWEGDNKGSMDLYETGWVKGENHRWGSGIADDLYINQISIPGTHDSAADEASWTCDSGLIQTIVVQSESIPQQLNAGVRFFDIRTRFYNDSFPLHHGSCFLDTHFDTEMQHIKDFLIQNPSEFIIIMMKKEHKTEGNTKTYQQVFDDYLKELDMVDMWDLTYEFKTIKELRGKIILVDRTYEIKGGISIDNWRDNIKGTQYVGWNDVDVEVQDFYSFGYTDSSVNGKKDVIMDLINYSSSVPASLSSTLTLNFTSGYFNYWTGVPGLGDSRINPWLNEYLSDKSGKHLGIIISDYNSSNARQSLKDNIIKQNFVN